MEDHTERRNKILAKHPEISTLMHPDSRTFVLVCALASIQTILALCIVFFEIGFIGVLFLSYSVGAVISHALFLCVHETSHLLVFKTPKHNRCCALIANLPAVMPYAGVFRHFHMLHHNKQGVVGVDTDLPTAWEAWLVSDSCNAYGDRCLRKALYLSVYLLIYALRPLIVSENKPDITCWVYANWLIQGLYCTAMVYIGGKMAILYLVISTFLAGSLHPVAAHFQAEHTEQVPGVETYSYYGPLNYVSLNVGFHNEHHDFPNIPWTNLPKVNNIAHEFYPGKRSTRWPCFMWDYVTKDRLGPQARVLRGVESKTQKEE